MPPAARCTRPSMAMVAWAAGGWLSGLTIRRAASCSNCSIALAWIGRVVTVSETVRTWRPCRRAPASRWKGWPLRSGVVTSEMRSMRHGWRSRSDTRVPFSTRMPTAMRGRVGVRSRSCSPVKPANSSDRAGKVSLGARSTRLSTCRPSRHSADQGRARLSCSTAASGSPSRSMWTSSRVRRRRGTRRMPGGWPRLSCASSSRSTQPLMTWARCSGPSSQRTVITAPPARKARVRAMASRRPGRPRVMAPADRGQCRPALTGRRCAACNRRWRSSRLSLPAVPAAGHRRRRPGRTPEGRRRLRPGRCSGSAG